MTSLQTIPVLNFDDFGTTGDRRQQFIQQLGMALEEIGFFALINHGVESTLIRTAYQAVQAFFELPDSVKQRYEIPELNGQRGFTSFGREHAKDSPYPDLKEFWHVGRELQPAHLLAGMYAANLPVAEVSQFHPVLMTLYQQLETCATELLKACALYLGESESLLADMIQDGDTILRVIHYPPTPPDANPASQRAAAHEDINLITLLCEATDDGLELLQRDDTWLPVRSLPGQIIVDSGDMLQHLTNGRLKSTTHRVVNAQRNAPSCQQSRFSMPFFVHPRREVDLTPLPSCIAQAGTQLFAPITAGDYLMQRLREIGLVKAEG